MGYRAKRELLAQIAPRYREAHVAQKTVILDEFVAATGYDRKYAIRLLSKPVPTPGPIRRPRPRRYGTEVQQALSVAWAATNYVCAKRLVPFLPELVTALETHGHLRLQPEVRAQLLAISPATADRLLQALRRQDQPRGISTTKAGPLLKQQVPVRTFADWNEAKPGFLEADLVAHAGTSLRGSFLWTLTVTDVATGWTECQALRYRGQDSVVTALERVRQLLPFPVLGIDTDNGSEFLNNELISFCSRNHITFTRGRAYRKNDQCYVEQKNGSIVRQLVGYDRFDGEAAYQQLVELYRAVRLFVNFFQPSMKLETKRREGSKVQRQYALAQTPWQRLQTAHLLTEERSAHLGRVFAALDPVRLLRQIQQLQTALWKRAVVESASQDEATSRTLVSFQPQACVASGDDLLQHGEFGLVPPSAEVVAAERERNYRKVRKKPQGPRLYRTRVDPFEAVREEVQLWVLEAPERTGAALLAMLQERYPGQYPDKVLRTLQRRLADWRQALIVTFDDRIVQEDVLMEGGRGLELQGKFLASGSE